jgi:hypothetical protein
MSMITNIPTPMGTRNTAMGISISIPTTIRTNTPMSTNIRVPQASTTTSTAGSTASIPTIIPATIKRPTVMNTARERDRKTSGIGRQTPSS